MVELCGQIIVMCRGKHEKKEGKRIDERDLFDC